LAWLSQNRSGGIRWNPAQSEHDWRETGAHFMDVQAARFMLVFM
jgi:hypothetical protein